MDWFNIDEVVPEKARTYLVSDGYDITSAYYTILNYWEPVGVCSSDNSDVDLDFIVTHWAEKPNLPVDKDV